ncbi:hypothetical protein V8E53_007478 [Lactarius tabidus]
MILRHVPGSLYSIRILSRTFLEREQAEAAAAGVPMLISSSPPSVAGTHTAHLNLLAVFPPSHLYSTTDDATYAKILTWFLDSLLTLCPFSAHRMALARKEFGKGIGQWFGQSTTAGAINLPDALLGVSVTVDSQIFQTDVNLVSHPPSKSPRPHNLSK